MSTTTGRVSNEDCPLCTPGYYCPNDTVNVHGIPCRSTYECPEGMKILFVFNDFVIYFDLSLPSAPNCF